MKAFFDTNVLLYAYTGPDPAKRKRAKETLADFSGRLVISTQVVQEFYAVAARKSLLPRAELLSVANQLLELPLVTIGPDHIRSAIQIEQRYGISFWDALIVAAAEAGGADVLLTEDLNDGQHYGAVLARNPFRM